MSSVTISTLYFKTNSLSSEKLTGGLLMVCPQQVFFAYSKKKMGIADKLTEKTIRYALKGSLQQIQNYVDGVNTQYESYQKPIQPLAHHLTPDYFEYLSRYNGQGLLQFGEMQPVAVQGTETDFANLYKAYVGEPLQPKTGIQKPPSFSEKVKGVLNDSRLKEKADVAHVFQPDEVEGILKPTKVSLATKNGEIELYQAVDFEMKPDAVATALYSFEFLVNGLAHIARARNIPLKQAIVFEEPPLDTPGHQLFDTFWKLKKETYGPLQLEVWKEKAQEIQKDEAYGKLTEWL